MLRQNLYPAVYFYYRKTKKYYTNKKNCSTSIFYRGPNVGALDFCPVFCPLNLPIVNKGNSKNKGKFNNNTRKTTKSLV